MINYDTTRGSSVTVQTDSSSTQSRLTIHQAVESDTGNYTCSASNTKPASIYVFVTEGKNNSFNNSSSHSIFSLMKKKKKRNQQTNIPLFDAKHFYAILPSVDIFFLLFPLSPSSHPFLSD